MRREAGFTLVEIMIVVSVIALLAMIALPSFLRARERAQNAKFENALRITSDAFAMYNVDNGAYPADVNRGIVPPGMAPYFGSKVRWTEPTPLGGNWDWDNNQFGFSAGISVVGASAPPEQLTDVDQRIDDGDLSTGGFRSTAASRYTAILE